LLSSFFPLLRWIHIGETLFLEFFCCFYFGFEHFPLAELLFLNGWPIFTTSTLDFCLSFVDTVLKWIWKHFQCLHIACLQKTLKCSLESHLRLSKIYSLFCLTVLDKVKKMIQQKAPTNIIPTLCFTLTTGKMTNTIAHLRTILEIQKPDEILI
jgi:hypothetical protein